MARAPSSLDESAYIRVNPNPTRHCGSRRNAAGLATRYMVTKHTIPSCMNIFLMPPLAVFHIRNPKISVDLAGWPPNMCINTNICARNCSTIWLYARTALSLYGHASPASSSGDVLLIHALYRADDDMICCLVQPSPAVIHDWFSSSLMNECPNALSPCRSSIFDHGIRGNAISSSSSSPPPLMSPTADCT